MRNEIRSLMYSKGMPFFFITINPADVYNPLVRFLAGEDIDVYLPFFKRLKMPVWTFGEFARYNMPSGLLGPADDVRCDANANRVLSKSSISSILRAWSNALL